MGEGALEVSAVEEPLLRVSTVRSSVELTSADTDEDADARVAVGVGAVVETVAECGGGVAAAGANDVAAGMPGEEPTAARRAVVEALRVGVVMEGASPAVAGFAEGWKAAAVARDAPATGIAAAVDVDVAGAGAAAGAGAGAAAGAAEVGLTAGVPSAIRVGGVSEAMVGVGAMTETTDALVSAVGDDADGVAAVASVADDDADDARERDADDGARGADDDADDGARGAPGAAFAEAVAAAGPARGVASPGAWSMEPGATAASGLADAEEVVAGAANDGAAALAEIMVAAGPASGVDDAATATLPAAKLVASAADEGAAANDGADAIETADVSPPAA